MPKQVAEIRNFIKGMITNIDITDVPIDTPVYNEGLETLNASGALIGAPIDDSIIDGYMIDFGIPTKDHELRDAILFVTENGNLYWFYNLYDDVTVVSLFDSTTGTTTNKPEAGI